MIDQVEIRQGHLVDDKDIWVWPKQDVGCWDWMNLEKDLPNHILPFVDNFNVCVNAGAHAGIYTYKYSNLFKKVFAIEPHPVNFHCLCRNVTKDNVIKLQVALSDDTKMVGLTTANVENSGGYYISPGTAAMTIRMDTIPINPDLIHLDVEGHEYEVLLGAESILQCSDPVIVLETIPNYDYKNAENLLFDFGYEIVLKLRNDTIYKRAR